MVSTTILAMIRW